MPVNVINGTTCDICRRIFSEQRKHYYCEHCKRYFHVCSSCQKENARCTYCGVYLVKKIEPVRIHK